MIKDLALKNWRSYEDVKVSFKPGTTFVVASNGVGKSSLMEALRWALFGKIARDGVSVIRVGTTSASVSATLELPDRRLLTIERSMSGKPRRGGEVPIVHLDGERLPAEDLEPLLANSYRTEPTFLANLTVPESGRPHSATAKLDISDHIGKYYGIDTLRIAIEQLAALIKQCQADVKKIKGENSATAQHLGDLTDAVDLAANEVSAAEDYHRAALDRLERARERERAENALLIWEQEQSRWAEVAKALTDAISDAIGRDVTLETAEELLGSHLAGLDESIANTRITIAVAEERRTMLQRNDERIDTAHNDCPVCRRPLDESITASAHQANQRDIEAIEREIDELRASLETNAARRPTLAGMQNRWRQLERPRTRPAAPPESPDEVGTVALDDLRQTAFDFLVDARTRQSQARTQLEQARAADEAMRRLETLFRQEATLTVALKTTQATRDELLEDIVRPLASELNQRWRTLFPARGDVRTSASGDITRSISGYDLPFEEFSTGEGMGAAIFVRLLAAQMASGANFCWFDEPLEHLDPDARRRVANVLSRATSGEGPLRQVIVTTYEDQLARHLHDRDTDRVHILDVRSAS